MSSALAILLALGTFSSAAEPVAIPVEGQSFPARLQAVDDQWQLTFSAGEQPRQEPASGLVRWGEPVEAVARPTVVLADGGLLGADLVAADRDKIEVESLAFGRLSLPLAWVAGVVLAPPAGLQQRDLLLDRIARAEGNADRVLLLNGDEIGGVVESVAEEKLRLAADVGPLEIELGRVSALVFNPSLVRRETPEGLRAWVGLADGSLLLARQLVLDQGGARITVLGGQTWTALPEDVVFLQPLGGQVVYLSDLQAASYKHVPYLDLSWPYERDRNVLGGRLRVGGKLYQKGLGMHTACRLTYALAGQYRRLDALLALDDVAERGGSVRYRVFVDGVEKHTSDTLRGGDAPVPLSLDVAGAKRLDLVIDYADRGPVLDRADWLDARLAK